MLIPVILSGGSGTRLWPLSREGMPKQFLSLLEGPSLFQETLLRLPPEGLEPPMVIANQDHRFRVAEQMQAMHYTQSKIILEPCGRNTAPAIVVAALIACSHPSTQEACLLVLPSDHHIQDPHALACAMAHAERHAQAGNVVTFGIVPTYPATGYGYIQAGESLSPEPEKGFKVKAFKEKPDESTAQAFIEAGHYFWNSGMFIWSVRSLRKAMMRHCPSLTRLMDLMLPHIGKATFDQKLLAEYENLSKISIDYALMEKADNIVMARGAFAWDDVGSWPALENHFPKDEQGNTVIGNAEMLGSDGNIVYSRGQLTACVGVSDLIVVQAEGVTLVCAKDQAQCIKQMVKRLHERGDCGDLL